MFSPRAGSAGMFPHMSEDVNERVKREWRADTTPGERVRSIMIRTYEAQSVSAIAERAIVDEEVARLHLQRLDEDGFVEEKEDGEYRRVPESVVRERAEQILDAVDAETLEERVEELRETVSEYRTAGDLSGEEITKWQTDLRNLYIAETALEFAKGEIPEGVVRAAEQLNRGESVSKEEMMEGLHGVNDCDDE